MNSPKRNSHAPHSLRLEAVRLGHARPVAHVQNGTINVQIRRGGSNECVCALCLSDLGSGLADDVAVQVRHGLAERDGADDEGDEKQRVDGCHDEKTQVGVRPVVADADDDVEGCDASLD